MAFFKNLFSKKEEIKAFDLSTLKVDIHSHLIPGIDDGAKNMDETIAMLAKFENFGFRKIITTPHIMPEVYPNTPQIILDGLKNVRETAEKLGLTIQIEAAAEYYFDDSLITKVKEGSVLSFGENFVLVEFSFHTPPSFENQLFFEMQMAEYKPVLAHFERYPYYHGSVDKAKEFRDNGVNIQINLNSLSGNYGPEVKKQTERLIDAKLVDFVGSDCHRIQHLLLMEENLKNPYFHKLADLDLKNRSL